LCTGACNSALMSATSQSSTEDPRVARSCAAAIEAGRTLFLRDGYAGTTMEEIAALAGLSKRTLYNNYADKRALFTETVGEVIAYAERFAQGLEDELEEITAAGLPDALHDLGERLALAILRPEVIALRQLLIGAAGAFPELPEEYFERAPGRVMAALASRFERLDRAGLLRTTDPRRAAEQFAYLVVGAPLDRAVLVGTIPAEAQTVAGAHEGVETFLARYAGSP